MLNFALLTTAISQHVIFFADNGYQKENTYFLVDTHSPAGNDCNWCKMLALGVFFAALVS